MSKDKKKDSKKSTSSKKKEREKKQDNKESGTKWQEFLRRHSQAEKKSQG